MKSVKSKLIVSDLDSNSKEFNFGVSTSYGVLTSRAHYFMDYSMDDSDSLVLEGASINTAEFMEYEDNKQLSKEDIVKANSYMEAMGVNVEGLDSELVSLIASQMVDVEEFPNAYMGSNNTDVTVTLQRQSANGNWFNVTDKDKNKVEFTCDISDLFNLDDQGSVESFKTATNRDGDVFPVIVKIMEKAGYSTVNNYQYVDQETKELVFKSQQQRYLVKSSCLCAGVVLENQRLESTVASFFNKVDLDTQEVYQAMSYYGYDNVVDFENGIAIIPSDKDESNGDAANKSFNDGILTGTSVATIAMMSDDMTIAAIAANRSEENIVVREGKRARSASFTKKNLKSMNDKELLASELGTVVLNMVSRTWAALKDASLQNEIFSELKAFESNASDLMKVVQAHKNIHGKGFAYPSWKALDLMITTKKNKEFADAVDSHVLANITLINKGFLTVDRLTVEQVIEIRETSIKFGKKLKAAWITNPVVSNALKVRYAEVTGTKVA